MRAWDRLESGGWKGKGTVSWISCSDANASANIPYERKGREEHDSD